MKMSCSLATQKKKKMVIVQRTLFFNRKQCTRSYELHKFFTLKFAPTKKILAWGLTWRLVSPPPSYCLLFAFLFFLVVQECLKLSLSTRPKKEKEEHTILRKKIKWASSGKKKNSRKKTKTCAINTCQIGNRVNVYYFHHRLTEFNSFFFF